MQRQCGREAFCCHGGSRKVFWDQHSHFGGAGSRRVAEEGVGSQGRSSIHRAFLVSQKTVSLTPLSGNWNLCSRPGYPTTISSLRPPWLAFPGPVGPPFVWKVAAAPFQEACLPARQQQISALKRHSAFIQQTLTHCETGLLCLLPESTERGVRSAS